jgi:BirA family biotin operon repressor/biotin-[acetyl-CoA-carboxylase] ligase
MSLRTRHFNEIDSTQDFAIALLNSSRIDSDYAITADSQTAGRGRLNDKKWISTNGNFHCSYIINIQNVGIVETETNTLNHTVMTALFDFLKGLIINSNNLRLKLPNDILVGNKKLAGVLIEILYPHAIIGIGINLISSPIERATNLRDEFNLLVTHNELTENLYTSILTKINKCYRA